MLARSQACQPGTVRLGVHDALRPSWQACRADTKPAANLAKETNSATVYPEPRSLSFLSSSNIINYYKRP